MKILLAPNSFKESLDSVTISSILLEYLKNNSTTFFCKPLSDGGDGFLKIIEYNYQINDLNNNKIISYSDHIRQYPYIYNESGRTIYIETAELFGLKLIEESLRNPMIFNSESLGKMIAEFVKIKLSGKAEIEKIIIGVGGTSTIDAGFGACSRLGLKFFASGNNQLEVIPQNFNDVEKITFDKVHLPFQIKFIVDIDRQLIGDPGSIEVYGKQKGGNDYDLARIKNGIIHVLDLLKSGYGYKIPDNLNGSGGGLAAGFSIFYDSEIIPASKFIKQEILNDINPDEIDLVISGEGKFDYQSFEGKGTGVIIDLFKNTKCKIVLINGYSELPVNLSLPENLSIINISEFFSSREESIKNTEKGIRIAADMIKSQFGL